MLKYYSTLNYEFEWNPDKAEKNKSKHGVSFEDATRVFSDPLAITFPDLIHSNHHDRFVTIGWAKQQQTLVVIYRESGHRIHLISARRATRREKISYEEGNDTAPLFWHNTN